MVFKKNKDCSKCKYSTSYGSSDSPNIECNSTNYDIRKQFKINGKYYASKCDEFEEKGSIRDGFILDNYNQVILGGKGHFILHSTKTNQDFEYKLTRVDSNIKDIKYLYYLYIKFGEQEIYAGTVYYSNNEQEFKFSEGEKGNVDSNDISLRSLMFVLNKILKNKDIQYLELLHVGECSVCGEKLKEEDDIRTGVHNKCIDNLDFPEIITDF